MITTSRTVKSVLGIALVVIISKALGFIRDMLIASQYGTSMETDAYFVATTVTQVLIVGIASSLNTTIIPILSKLKLSDDKNIEIKFINNIMNFLLITSFGLIIINWIFTPLIVKAIANGFEGEKYQLTILLSRIIFPSAIFILLTSVFQGFLRSNYTFIIPASVGIPYNIVFVVFLIFLSKEHGIIGLGFVTVIACFAQLFINIPLSLKHNYSYKFIIDLKDIYLRKALKLTVPIILSSMIKQINTVIDRMLASNLVEGSISALNFADKINNIVLSMFITGIVTVIYPMISRYAIDDDIEPFNKTINDGMIIVLSITIPATIGIIIFAVPIVEVLLQRGAFGSLGTKLTSDALVYYSIGLPSLGIINVLNKAFYSKHDTKTPMNKGVIAIFINIVLNFLLIDYLKHAGLALASSISLIVNSILLMKSLKRKDCRLDFTEVKNSFTKIVSATCIMGVVLYYVKSKITFNDVTLLYKISMLGLSIICGLIVYVLACYFLKVKITIFKLNKNQYN